MTPTRDPKQCVKENCTNAFFIAIFFFNFFGAPTFGFDSSPGRKKRWDNDLAISWQLADNNLAISWQLAGN